ncbi:PEP-CTERM sorting domain-containing protein [Mariniblastus fucicola]|uniref:Ice-binding protein C-terminal domain-containing protein n=1 Tax=Mariniblastus fucicola TaxID=980251 RepID=A0A5B9P5R9_9BACT|nr:PEP-CTERM sorting domain-containing protein [Mariniblastus fucicola]QEG20849.1 hypothetical protein MFFC18_07000 [Mariniblastus fucicola]
MKNYSILLAVAFSLVLWSNTASAEIIVHVGNVTVDAGTNALVQVTATGDENLTSFDTPFDIGNDGFPNIAPTGLTLIDVVSAEPFGTGLFFNAAENLQEDLIVNDVSLATGVLLDSSPTLLFTMEFAVGNSVPSGTVFDLTVIRDDKFVINGTSNPGPGTSPVVDVNNGSITVSAVPEPSSLALAALVVCGITLRRRRSS